MANFVEKKILSYPNRVEEEVSGWKRSNGTWSTKFTKNRPGLLGDVASLMGMLDINIVSINGVEDRKRGMLLQTHDDEIIDLMGRMLKKSG